MMLSNSTWLIMPLFAGKEKISINSFSQNSARSAKKSLYSVGKACVVSFFVDYQFVVIFALFLLITVGGRQLFLRL